MHIEPSPEYGGVTARDGRSPGEHWPGWRWWGAGGGLAVGLLDAVLMARLGVSFEAGGRDVTLLVGGYFGLSFAVLGFLLGYAFEARRRDRRAAEVIRAQTEAVATARARLVQSEKLAALGQLASAVAHEVRNPLAVIRSAAQEINECLADGEARRACSFITTEIDRLNNVIGSLLAFARPLQVTPRTVTAAELLEGALLLVRDELRGKCIEAVRSVPEDLPALQADPDLLGQVLLGLLANAIAATPPGGTIALRARDDATSTSIEVADTGPGVPPELRARIFEPFFTTRERGTGLGLAIARQIVQAHGGELRVSDREGGGACFSIVLPRASGSALAA